jgi:large subunit ribosomal protein L4
MSKKVAKIMPVIEVGKKKLAERDLPQALEQEVAPGLLAQALHVFRQRARVRRAQTKDRSEVRGGGRKPWQQKGTGRARHGSIRSPIWVGGGVTFGPRSRKSLPLQLPKAMRRQALAGTLAYQLSQNKVAVLKLAEELPKTTKEFAKLMHEWQAVFPQTGSCLVIVGEEGWALQRVAKNVPRVKVVLAKEIALPELMVAGSILITEEALKQLEQRMQA